MATVLLATIKLRGDEAADWTSVNPVLANKEIGLETDTGLIKIGDGASSWTALGYALGGIPVAALGDLSPAADKLPYFTGSATAALADFPAQARTFLAATDQEAQRDALDLGTSNTPEFAGIRLNLTPTAETITPTHTITINVNGTDYKIPVIAA